MRKILGTRRPLAVLLASLLCLFCVLPGLAAGETAKTVQLMKTEGTVSVSNSSGKKLSVRDSMRLYNGYRTKTEAAGYAWFSLDSSKLSKLDEASEMELRKSGKKLELLLNAGNLYFNVTEPLETDETLNIRTSTMVVGIRGTCGWVRVVDQWHSQLYVLEGRVTCSVTDPVTGQTKTAVLTGGQWASLVIYPQDRSGDKCDIIRQQKYTESTIPGFVQTELAGDRALCEKIYSDSGLDLRNLTQSQAQQRLKADQAAMAAKLEAGKEQQSAQESQVSTDPVWPENVNNNQGSGSGSGGSGGGSGTTTPPTGITNTTPTTTQALTMAMPVTIPQIQAALNQASASSVTVTGSGTLTQAAGETLTVPAGKTLTLDSGVTLVENGTLNVNGTVNVNGNLDNYGTINVTSPNSLHVSGYFRNHAANGVINNKDSGHIVPAQGIENLGGTITISGNAVLESKGAAATVKNASSGTLNLNGGSISNSGSGAAIQMENSGDIPAAFTNTATTNIWSASEKPVVDASGEVPAIQNYKVVTNGEQTSLRPTGGVEGGVLTYTVNFDANGGLWKNNKPISITVERNTALGTPPDSPERAGYDFAEWQDASGNVYNVNDLTVTSDLNLYAHWTPKSGTETPGRVTITFDPNGGTLSSVSSVEIDKGGSLPYLPTAPARDGYTFTGWSGAQSAYDTSTTLTAQWEPAELPSTEKVTITFMAGQVECGSIEIDKGSLLPYPPPEPYYQREGYLSTFEGWYYELDGDRWPLGGGDSFLEDTTLYAEFTDYPMITFKLSDESADGLIGGGEWIMDYSYGYQGSMMYLQVPTKDKPLPAALDGLDAQAEEQSFLLTVVPQEPVKEGFRFLGWCLPHVDNAEARGADLSNVDYTSSQLWAAEFTDPTMLYPVWERLSHTGTAASDLYLNDGVTTEDIMISLAEYDEVIIHSGSSDPNSTQDAVTDLILDGLLTIPLDKRLSLDSGVNVELTGLLLNGGYISSVTLIPDAHRPDGFVEPTFTISTGSLLNARCITIDSLRVTPDGHFTNMGYTMVPGGIEIHSSTLINLDLICADIYAAHSHLHNYRTIEGSLTVHDEIVGDYTTAFYSGSEVTGDVTISSFTTTPTSDFRNQIRLEDTQIGSYAQDGGRANITGTVTVTADTPSFTLSSGVLWINGGYISCPIEQTGGTAEIDGGELTDIYTISGGQLIIDGGIFSGQYGIQRNGGDVTITGGLFVQEIIRDTDGADVTAYLGHDCTAHSDARGWHIHHSAQN